MNEGFAQVAMSDFPPSPDSSTGFERRLLVFGRLLRRHGLQVGTRHIADLAEALTLIDLSRQEDVYHAMRCFLVHGPEERELFDRLYELYWLRRLTFGLETGSSASSSPSPATVKQPSSGLHPPPPLPQPPDARDEDETSVSVTPTYSALELLRHKDFADYTGEEQQRARQFMHSLLWRLGERTTRRRVRSRKETAFPDLRRAIQRSIRRRGEFVELAWRRRQRKPRPLVVICDVSGSMERYSRLFLYMMFALVQETGRIETFVFGTRLTRITPALRHTDLDAALAATGQTVVDWSGGTRIGESLRTFNYRWARRVLGHGAAVLIISDGWDRGDQALLEREIRRLHRQTPQLIWLNPLAGRPDYQPLVRGIQTILPHVDEFLPLHNLETVAQLAGKLGMARR